MVDPGSAVGTISLGIQVAQGLLKYYSHFRSYDEDISHAIQRVERLHSTFATLEVPLGRLELNNDSISKRVRISLNSCKQELLELEDVVKKCTEVPVPHTTLSRMQRVKNKALYPFRRSTLVGIEKWVQIAQTDLDAAIQVLQLKFGVDFQDRFENQATMASNQLSLIKNGQLDTMSKLDSLYASTQSNTQQTNTIVSRVDRNVESLIAQQQQMAQQFSTLIQLTKSITNHRNLSPSAVGEGIVLSQEFDLSSNSANQQGNREEYQRLGTSSRFGFISNCTCTKKKHAKEQTLFRRTVTLHWHRDADHDASCPLSHTSRRSNTVSVRIRSCAFVFNYILEAAVNCTRGAGGYSIGQTLALRRIVSNHNPAFLLLRPDYDRNYPRDESVNYGCLEEIAQILDRYFRDGIVSPADVADDHGTLLQAACDLIAFEYPRNVEIPSVDHALKFLNFLIDTGVPTTYTHSIRQFYPRSNIIMIPMDCVPSYSALNQLLICPWEKNIQGTKYLSSFLFDRGNIWSEQHDTWVFPPPFYVSHPQVLTTDLIEQVFAESPISSAIMRRSILKLKMLLKARCDLSSTPLKSSELTRYLSMCAGWPNGIRTVLEFIRAQHLVLRSDIPLIYAFYLQNWESVDILFQAGFKITHYLLSLGISMGGEILHHMILKIPQQPHILQQVPQPFWDVDFVYHDCLTFEAVEAFYNAGIRTLDTESPINLRPTFSMNAYFRDSTTPLWKTAEGIFSIMSLRCYTVDFKNSVKVARWLIGKGARKAWFHPRFRTTPAHLIPLVLLCRLIRCSFTDQLFGLDSWWDFYAKTVVMAEKDFCCCACSRDGCLPLISSFKHSVCKPGAMRFYHSKISKAAIERHWITQVARAIDEILLWMDALLSTSLDMANAVLRVLTFEELGIRHTCHEMAIYRNIYQGGSPPYSEEDIDEFHNEDAELIARLESLVAEFENAYASSKDPSFYNFSKEYWRPRMNKVMAEMEEVTEEYVSGVKQVGVVLKPLGPKPPPGIESTY